MTEPWLDQELFDASHFRRETANDDKQVKETKYLYLFHTLDFWNGMKWMDKKFIIFKSNSFQLWFLYKSDLRISTAGKNENF